MTKEEIIKFLAEKYNVPRYTIKEIIDSPNKFISESFNKRELKNFIVPALGKFVIQGGKKYWIEKNIIPKVKERDEERAKKWKEHNEKAKLKKNEQATGDI